MDLDLLHCLYTNYLCDITNESFVSCFCFHNFPNRSNVHAATAKETKAFHQDRLGDYHYYCVLKNFHTFVYSKKMELSGRKLHDRQSTTKTEFIQLKFH